MNHEERIGGFIIHVYMGTAMVRGGFTSIRGGDVFSPKLENLPRE